MHKSLLRIPYPGPLPPARVHPRDATTLPGAIAALSEFLSLAPSTSRLGDGNNSTLILSGAGVSVASGLADYRGVNGTYTRNKTYRPIYYQDFIQNHEARKRYWARSFFGWHTLNKAKPNAAHYAIKELGELGMVQSIITQNVDSLHPRAHPALPTLELHGFLRSLVCINCHSYMPRSEFQQALSALNPAWADLLEQVLASGALDTEDPTERRARGLKTNPDGDVDLPNVQYSTFRYPACSKCLHDPPLAPDGELSRIEVDADGAWLESSTAGILKPAVIMFGESIPASVKSAAESAIDDASKILVIGSSLATYSAWRLVRRAKDRGMPIGVINLGGVRGEHEFFKELGADQGGQDGVRIEMAADKLLPAVMEQMKSGRLP